MWTRGYLQRIYSESFVFSGKRDRPMTVCSNSFRFVSFFYMDDDDTDTVDVDVFVVPAEDEFEVLVLAFSVLVALELVYSVLFVVFSSLIFKL